MGRGLHLPWWVVDVLCCEPVKGCVWGGGVGVVCPDTITGKSVGVSHMRACLTSRVLSQLGVGFFVLTREHSRHPALTSLPRLPFQNPRFPGNLQMSDRQLDEAGESDVNNL